MPENDFSHSLRQLILSIEAGGRAVLPNSNNALLQSIVEAAARIFQAAAASILLVNEREQVLVFKVATGAANRDLVGMKFPLDKGIAGYVVMTGQPLTISDVRQDARFNQDFAKNTGYVPNSILAAPLIAGDRVIGVMEVLDKISAASFGLQDMEILTMFANQAALAIDQSQKIQSINQALVVGLKRLVQEDPALRDGELAANLDQIGQTQDNGGLLALADLFYSISALGEAEQRACLEVLQTFAKYLRLTQRKWR